jgi:hypothetical protein
MFESNIKQPCPVCGEQIQKVRPIVFKGFEHGEFSIMEINRSQLAKGKKKITKMFNKKREDSLEIEF